MHLDDAHTEPALDPLELASGLVLGLGPRKAVEARPVPPAAALATAVLPALRRPPCFVSFSGGRDSSIVLAIATAVARREGEAPPIPVTNRFPAAPETEESAWQERVVSHLRVDDWVRLDHRDDLDCVGPVATGVLRRHGLLWPFNAHFHVPLLAAASGGSLLTGVGGDEALSPSSWQRPLDVLRLRVRPEPKDLGRVALALAPRPLRRAVLRRLVPDVLGWLRPAARREVVRRLVRQGASEPLRWRGRFERLARLRYLRLGAASLALLAEDADVRLVNPFLDPGFLQALGRLPRLGRFETRAEGARLVAGALLPPNVLSRESKARFDEVFWSEHSRIFAAAWDGRGVDAEIVDPERLAQEFRRESPDPRTYLLAQAARLSMAPTEIC